MKCITYFVTTPYYHFSLQRDYFRSRSVYERANGRTPVEAVENTLPATGMALLGAAASTALGFGVLAFASMKMFAAFGIMTAFMVVYSFAAQCDRTAGAAVAGGQEGLRV